MVTAKPPNIFILAMKTANPDRSNESTSVDDIWVRAPIIIILLTAFVTDIKGVCREVDIIITTALIPGKEAPKLITEEMVHLMKPGSVIVDLASQQGGNCELCIPNQINESNGVKIIGYTDLPSRLPSQSSELYANNLYHIIDELTPNNDGVIDINM